MSRLFTGCDIATMLHDESCRLGWPCARRFQAVISPCARRTYRKLRVRMGFAVWNPSGPRKSSTSAARPTPSPEPPPSPNEGVFPRPASHSVPNSPGLQYPYCLQCITRWKNFSTFGQSGSAYYPLVLVPAITTLCKSLFFNDLENRLGRAYGTSSAYLYSVRKEVRLGLKWR
jgi:hypothetical protein